MRHSTSDVPRGFWGIQLPPPRKFRRPSKIVSNSTRLWKLLKLLNLGLQDVRKKGSKILKLPRFANKWVVIINSLKVPKIKKFLLYEMNFLVPNYSCHQNSWLGGRGLPPPDPRSMSSALNWICWNPLPRTKFLVTPLHSTYYRL